MSSTALIQSGVAGAPAFQWGALDISKGPSLPREADKVVQLYRRLAEKYRAATHRQDKENILDALDALRSSIELRIEELEEFYLAHDSDERSILFEKQRLKLRRLLHSDNVTPNSRPPPPPAARPTVPIPAPTPPRPAARPQKKKSKSKRGKSYVRDPQLAYSTNKSPKKAFQATLKKSRAVMKSRVQPIYHWEKKVQEGEGQALPDDEDVTIPGPVNFQLRLTDKEFFKFTSMRRGAQAEKRHKARNMAKQPPKESMYLQCTGPYVDPERVTNSIYRTKNKDKWIDPKGIRGYQHL